MPTLFKSVMYPINKCDDVDDQIEGKKEEEKVSDEKKMVDGASKRITNGPNIICWNAGVAQDLTADGIVAIGPLWSTMAYYGLPWSNMVH